MELKLFNKLTDVCKKYKYAILILLIGLVLMMFPGTKTKEISKAADQETAVSQQPLEERLSEILCQVEGAGNVKVILTISAGSETLFQSDEDNNHSDDAENIHKDTVIISDASHNETGLVRQVLPEIYQGAIIVCQGADDASVRLAIVDAVSKLTGLGANCISVLKMK